MTDVIRVFRVTGKVQGVFFRQGTRHEAERLSLRGYACNMSDGSVRVLAAGSVEAVLTLRDWLQSGPEHARVSAVEEMDLRPEDKPPQGFETR